MTQHSTLRRFDKYLHELGIEHSHHFVADGELIIRKNLPDKESQEVQQREKGFRKFSELSNPVTRCAKEDSFEGK